MSDYTLYYWSVPFRGQFVRAVLAFAGRTWTEAGDAEIARLMDGPVRDMPDPFMGPPVLVDHGAEVAIAQMSAIVLYLGETLGLLPETAAGRARAMKVVHDANDVIDELTLDGGRQMWTEARWEEYEPRLRKWLAIWAETGRRHGLKRGSGFLLGGERASVADLVTGVLWTTIGDRFPVLKAIIEDGAPDIADLAKRVAALPPLADLADRARADYGDLWSGGKIEASLHRVLNGRT